MSNHPTVQMVHPAPPPIRNSKQKERKRDQKKKWKDVGWSRPLQRAAALPHMSDRAHKPPPSASHESSARRLTLSKRAKHSSALAPNLFVDLSDGMRQRKHDGESDDVAPLAPAARLAAPPPPAPGPPRAVLPFRSFLPGFGHESELRFLV